MRKILHKFNFCFKKCYKCCQLYDWNCIQIFPLLGKEAVILHAESDPSFPFPPEEGLPKECAIKVFKTTLSEFKQRDKYIKDDYRFKDRIGNQTAKKTIRIWAEKEMANLMRLRKVGIPCPQVVTLKHHVLVMSFIGENLYPAPKLKDAKMSNADYIQAYDEVGLV